MVAPSRAHKHDRSCYRALYDRSCYIVKVVPKQSGADGRTHSPSDRARGGVTRDPSTGSRVSPIGHLAGALDMSKSGVYAHFGSKQDLQLATVDEAGRIFRAEVIEPALVAAPGLAQLVAVCDAFFDHLIRRTFPGGCFFAGAALEMGTRPGPVKERSQRSKASSRRLSASSLSLRSNSTSSRPTRTPTHSPSN